MPVPYAFTTHDIDQAIYHVANALQIPVLILALLALAAVIYEFGAYLIELRGRRRRVFARISASAEQARRALLANDRSGAGSRRAWRRTESGDGGHARVHRQATLEPREAITRSIKRLRTSTSTPSAGSGARGSWCAPGRRSV